MGHERLRRIEELFHAALELPPDQREAFLTRACGDDAELRREVEALMDADGRAGGFLEQAAADGTGPRSSSDTLGARDRIGPYQVMRKIGQGGMSEVYLAVRADDEYRKRVALKVVKHDMDREDLLRRFRTERQILAGLDHPNIAKLLDGGKTEDGLPYFVMDYIEGVPVDRFCDQNRLSIRERLELFRTICSAVQYAHQNLIVHRDIKASNILVTADGVPKLLDFGIAKLLKPDQFAAPSEDTVTWLRPMTPHYASPEQIQGKLVGTPSDVYSLGVLLYKLLTGHLPQHLQTLPASDLPRAIVEQEPDKPSASVTRSEATSPGGPALTPEDVSRSRATHPQQLRRQLAGDLDNIVLMALRKEPQRRYPSVEKFSEDVQCYLTGLPVIARQDTVGYRAVKFLRRNRLAVGVAVAFVVLLIGFSVGMAVLASRASHERDLARRERDRAEQVVAFLQEIYGASDPFEARGREVTVSEILDEGAGRIESELAGQPEVQATLMNAIGRVYKNLGLFDEARPLLERALATRRRELGRDHPAVAESLHEMGSLLQMAGDYNAAAPLLREAVALRREHFGDEHTELAKSLSHLGIVMRQKGQFDEAERLHRQALEIFEAHPESLDLASTKNNLAALMLDQARLDEAESLFREVLELRSRFYDPAHPQVAESMNNLGVALGMQGRYAEAEPLLRTALENRRERLGDEHPWITHGLNNVGKLYVNMGRLDTAERLLREALHLERKRSGDDSPVVAHVQFNLAECLRDARRYAEAEPLARAALDTMRASLSLKHPRTGMVMIVLGSTLTGAGRPDEGETLLREGLGVLQSALPPDHWWIAEARSQLGGSLAGQGRFAEAEPLLVEGLEGVVRVHGPDHVAARAARERVVALYASWGKPAAAAAFRAPETR